MPGPQPAQRLISAAQLNRAIDLATIRMCRFCVREGYIGRADGVIATALIKEFADQLREALSK